MDRLLNKKCIYVVATPIGNIEDMTARGRRILANVDLILAEDTRQTVGLLKHLQSPNVPLLSYHDQIQPEKREKILERICDEELSVALVSDAGTPCISDPGYKLIKEARELGIDIVPIPGASALATLASASGLPSDKILFVGFLAHKEMAVEKEMKSWLKYAPVSIVFFDSLRRLHRDLTILKKISDEVKVAVGREMTKMHEEIVVSDVAETISWLKGKTTLKGEVTVQVYLSSSGSELSVEQLKSDIMDNAKERFSEGASLKDLLQEWRDCALSRSDLYSLLLEVKKDV